MKKKLTDIYKSIFGRMEYATKGFAYSKDELLVLCMHSTPKEWMPEFDELLTFLTQHFVPLDPSGIDHYYAGLLKDGPYVLFTFDDGLKNNLYAAETLEARGIRAMYFLVPEFIESADPKTYYLTHIRRIVDSSFDKSEEDFTPMSYTDVIRLCETGHTIGSHTYSHLLRAESHSESIEHEVKESQQRLNSMTGKPINSFCSPIDTLISVDSNAKELISSNYRYHFTTFPGLNGIDKDGQLIFRRNIEVNWPKGKIMFALGQWDLRRWDQRVARFRSL